MHTRPRDVPSRPNDFGELGSETPGASVKTSTPFEVRW